MSSEIFPSKEKRTQQRKTDKNSLPFLPPVCYNARVSCAMRVGALLRRSHPHQIIPYPGIAKLVSRLVWVCRGGIRDRVR